MITGRKVFRERAEALEAAGLRSSESRFGGKAGISLPHTDMPASDEHEASSGTRR